MIDSDINIKYPVIKAYNKTPVKINIELGTKMTKRIISIICCLALPITSFAQKTSGWNSLPEETVAALRMNFSEAILKKMQTNTKLGATVLNQTKINSLKELILKQAEMDSKFATGIAELRKAGFELNDIFALGNSNMGFGVIPDKNAFTVLMWADIKEKMMNKMYAQVQLKSGKGKKRTDIELAGQKVIYLTGGKDGSHAMISRIGNRLILALCNTGDAVKNIGSNFDESEDDPFGPNSSKSDSLKITPFQDEFVEGDSSDSDEQAPKVNNLALEGVIKKNFARFIIAQKGNGGGFASAALNKPGMAQARPEGEVICEGYVDITKLMKHLSAQSAGMFIDKKLLDMDNLQALSMWQSFDGKNLNSSFFLSCPQPRTGVLSILEQADLAVTPPNWVPANVKTYSHMSFDFMKLFDVVKTAAAAQMGQPVVDQQVARADTTLRALLQISVKELLGGFGKQMYMVDFGASDAAFVMGFNNPTFMSKAFEWLSPLVASQGIVRTKVQGFDGFTFKQKGVEISLFYGKKHIVFTTGKETLNTVISLISNPPKGKDALAASDKFQAFLAKESLGKSMAFSYGDGSKKGTEIFQILNSGGMTKEKILKDISDKAEKAFVKGLLDLMPTENDLNGVLGFTHAEIKKMPSGFIMKSKTALP